MPNYKEHANTGALIGGIAAFAFNYIHQKRRLNKNEIKEINLPELFISGIGGSLIGKMGGVLPDIIEPSKDPHHRKFFHSYAVASAVGYGIYKANNNKNFSKLAKGTLTTAGISYLSHLALDSQTPKGLPII
jgi:membrane-bound metal-dependent hydrolase YbcI (DUF457 family)